METIGKYRILKTLGRGGFGAVYLCEDNLEQKVAVKVFDPKDDVVAGSATSATSDAMGVLKERFRAEAITLRKLSSNPYIVDLYDFDDTEDGNPYYVMPYLSHSLVNEIGKDSNSRSAVADLPPELRPRRIPVDQAVRILTEVLEAMRAVHREGLVHRDLKPANILFDADGKVQVCDFGIAKLPDSDHSESGVGMGSRNYMSPEQRDSAKHVTAASDVYSIGVIAYRMLTGTLPVGRFDDPVDYAPTLSLELNDLIVRALSHDAADRPQDASEFYDLLKSSPVQVDVAGTALSDTAEDGDYSRTWVDEGVSHVRDELQPLRERVEKLLFDYGEVPAEEWATLEVMGSIAGVDRAGLDQLIESVTLANEQKLRPVQNFLAYVDKCLEEPMSESVLSALIVGGEAIGWDEDRVRLLVESRSSATPNFAADREPLPVVESSGRSIGKYQLVRFLGSSMDCAHFLALDEERGQEYEIKIFQPEDLESEPRFDRSSETGPWIALTSHLDDKATTHLGMTVEASRSRFMREIKILDSLGASDFIVQSVDCGALEDGTPFLVTPYFEKDLRALIGRDVYGVDALETLDESDWPRSLPVSDVLRIATQLLSSLRVVHEAGIVHRSLTPLCIKVDAEKRIALTDFGVAKVDDGVDLTATGMGMGSRNYMAPEQRDGAKYVDARADIYAVGCLMYRMLTRKVPAGHVAEPKSYVEDLPLTLNALVLQCLSKDRDERPESAAVMLAALEEAAAEFNAQKHRKSVQSDVTQSRDEPVDTSSLDTYSDLSISLQEAVRGGERQVEIARSKPCIKCRGQGLDCDVCKGQGSKDSVETIQLKLPPGTRPGRKFRIKQKGNESGRLVGDHYVTIAVAPDADVALEGDDLRFTVRVNKKENKKARVEEVSLLGRSVKIEVPANAKQGQVVRVRGAGMPASESEPTGDLHVEVNLYASDSWVTKRIKGFASGILNLFVSYGEGVEEEQRIKRYADIVMVGAFAYSLTDIDGLVLLTLFCPIILLLNRILKWAQAMAGLAFILGSIAFVTVNVVNYSNDGNSLGVHPGWILLLGILCVTGARSLLSSNNHALVGGYLVVAACAAYTYFAVSFEMNDRIVMQEKHIKETQRLLGNFIESVPQSGRMDAETVSAIRAYQSDFGLVVDGKLTKAFYEDITWRNNAWVICVKQKLSTDECRVSLKGIFPP